MNNTCTALILVHVYLYLLTLTIVTNTPYCKLLNCVYVENVLTPLDLLSFLFYLYIYIYFLFFLPKSY